MICPGTKATGIKVSIMDREHMSLLLMRNTLEPGCTANTTALVYLNGLMAQSTRASGKTVERMEMENLQGSMGRFMKVSGKTENITDKASLTLPTEVYTEELSNKVSS